MIYWQMDDKGQKRSPAMDQSQWVNMSPGTLNQIKLFDFTVPFVTGGTIHYWVKNCQVEVMTKFIKGMLNDPDYSLMLQINNGFKAF